MIRAWRWLTGHLAWDRFIFVFSVLVVAGVGLWYTSDVEHRLDCQARYNEANNARTRALTESAQDERAAERRVQEAEATLWLNPAIGRPRPAGQPIDPSILADFTELRAAYQAWRVAIADADADRALHPVPPPPSATCGD